MLRKDIPDRRVPDQVLHGLCHLKVTVSAHLDCDPPVLVNTILELPVVFPHLPRYQPTYLPAYLPTYKRHVLQFRL